MSTPGTTFDLVSGNFDQFREYANASLATANDALNELTGLGTDLINTAHAYTVGVPSIAPDDFDGITTPEFTPTAELPTVPSPPSFGTPSVQLPSREPTFTVPPPHIGSHQEPSAFSEQAPVFTDTLLQLDVIPAPDVAALLDGVLPPDTITLDFPDAPVLETLAFNEVLPTVNVGSIDEYMAVIRNGINVDVSEYSDDLIVRVKEKIDAMIAGGTGLPLAIEQAIYARAADRDDASARRKIEELAADFASRGYDMPPGAMASAVQRVRQESAELRAGTNREIAIEMARIEVESIKFAVAQGVAMSGVLIDAHFKRQELIIAVEQFVVASAVQVLNAEIARHNYYVEVYKAKAAVFETLVAAQARRVEIYRAQVEAESSKAVANRNEVEAYVARLNSVRVYVDMYVARLQGESAKLQQNAQVLDVFRQRLAAFGEQVKLHQVEWEAYSTALNSERTKVELFDAQVRAYGEETRAWIAKANFKLEHGRFGVELEKLKGVEYEAELEAVRTKIAAYVAESEARASEFSAMTQRIAAEITGEAEYARLTIADKQNEAQARSDAVRAALSQMQSIAQLTVARHEAVARTAAQLAAASLSGIGVSATISGSSSNSTQWNKSAGFEGAGTVSW